MKLFVSNLSFNTDNEDLFRIFGVIGLVASATIIRDKFTNRSRGFGFVQMDNNEAGLLAIQQLHNTQLKGQSIVVKRTNIYKS